MTTSMNNGQMFQQGQGMPLHLPDGKRLAYRMDYCVRESGNSYVAAVTSHTSYWANKDIAFFILTKMFPELENIPMPPRHSRLIVRAEKCFDHEVISRPVIIKNTNNKKVINKQ